MKKILLIAFLLFSFKCYSSPSNTMSITPVAVAEATILADDENTRNNAVSTTYNAHSHTDIPSSSSNDFIVGDGQAGDKTLSIDNGDANSPSLKFDDTDNVWEAGNDGVNFYELILGNTDQTIAGDKTFSNIITGTLTDSTLTIQSGKITAAESITSGTFTDGTLSIQSGKITSANSITSNTLTDGTLTIQSGVIASAGNITSTGTITASTLTDGTLSIGNGNITSASNITATGGTGIITSDSLVATSLILNGSVMSVNSQMFTSSGTFTAPTGITQVLMTGIAGGAGGGAHATEDSGGGGSGAWIERVGVDVIAGNSYTVTVGAGGAGGTVPGDGIDGGNSSFAGATITITLNGGDKGLSGSNGGAGGAATGGNTVNGAVEVGGYDNLSTAGGNGDGNQANGGGGGGSRYGKGGTGGVSGAGTDGLGYGSGGGGGNNNADGGDGTGGFIRVEW